MRRTMIVMVSIALAVAACSSDPVDTTTTAASGAAAESTTTISGDGATTTEATAETTTTQAVDRAGDIEQCVVGEWELDSEGFFNVVMAEVEEAEGEFEYVGGQYLLFISDDGSFTNERRDWTFGFISDMGDFEVRINHVQTGTWMIDGDLLTTVSGVSEPPVIEFFIDGEPFLFPGGVSPVAPPEAEFEGATVACDGDTLSATVEGLTSTWSRN